MGCFVARAWLPPSRGAPRSQPRQFGYNSYDLVLQLVFAGTTDRVLLVSGRLHTVMHGLDAILDKLVADKVRVSFDGRQLCVRAATRRN